MHSDGPATGSAVVPVRKLVESEVAIRKVSPCWYIFYMTDIASVQAATCVHAVIHHIDLSVLG